jgi:hypothetical protein
MPLINLTKISPKDKKLNTIHTNSAPKSQRQAILKIKHKNENKRACP